MWSCSMERKDSMGPVSLSLWLRMPLGVIPGALVRSQEHAGLGLDEDRNAWNRRLDQAVRKGSMLRTSWTATRSWTSDSSDLAFG